MNFTVGQNANPSNKYDFAFTAFLFLAICSEISFNSFLIRYKLFFRIVMKFKLFCRALKDASQWYKENKALKRKTLLLMDKDTVDEGVDAGENESNFDTDMENLNKTIKQLSTEVAELKTELETIKQIEFQTSEENIKLSEVSGIISKHVDDIMMIAAENTTLSYIFNIEIKVMMII